MTTYDVWLKVSLTVEADTEEEAKQFLLDDIAGWGVLNLKLRAQARVLKRKAEDNEIYSL